MKLEDTVVSASYAGLMLRFLEKRELNADDVLVGTDIDPETFTLSNASISGAQFVRMCQNGFDLHGDRSVGVKYGLDISISSHGMVGFAAMASSTFGEGLTMMMRYYRSIFSMLSLELTEKNGKVHLKFDVPYDIGALQDVITDGFLIGLGTAANFLMSARLPWGNIRLKSEYYPYYEHIHDVFDAEVEYGCDVNELIFDASLLDVSLPAADPQTVLMAQEHCEQLLKQTEVVETFTCEVRRALLASKNRLPNLEALAQQFNMHPRTLGRRLSKQDTSYQELLDEVRGELALEYLADPKMLIEDIAYALNFNDTSSFYRAFKRWTGQTPSTMRKELLHQKEVESSSVNAIGEDLSAS